MSSPQGRVFARVHERWGLDPGMYFTDDVLAYNARVGFLAALADAPAQDGPGATQEPPPAPSTSRIVTDLEERMRAYGQ